MCMRRHPLPCDSPCRKSSDRSLHQPLMASLVGHGNTTIAQRSNVPTRQHRPPPPKTGPRHRTPSSAAAANSPPPATHPDPPTRTAQPTSRSRRVPDVVAFSTPSRSACTTQPAILTESTKQVPTVLVTTAPTRMIYRRSATMPSPTSL